MSHNDNIPERSARRHSPALLGILAALTLAALALLVFGGWRGRDDDGVTRELAPGTAATAPADTGSPAASAPAATTTAPAATIIAPAATAPVKP